MTRISKEITEKLKDKNINPDDVTKITSKYDKKLNKFITTITTKDDKTYKLYFCPYIYITRKNKR